MSSGSACPSVRLSIGFNVGIAYAAPTIGTDDIEDNAIISQKIKDGEVKTLDLANGAVTKDKISASALKLVTVQRLVNYQVAAHTIGAGSAQCNKDEVVVGGGFAMSGVLQGTVTFASRPMVDANLWNVLARNPTDTAQTLQVYAMCAHLALGP